MIRTALRPQWLVLLALLVGVVALFVRLGLWQLSVSTDHPATRYAQEQAARPVQDLDTLVRPQQTFPAGVLGAPVRVSGRYVPELQFLVPDRRLDGRSGSWVVTPVRTTGSGSPALVAVARGFLPEGSSVGPPAAGEVTVTGALAPSEAPASAASPGRGERGSIDTAELANAWDEPIYNAFVFRETEQPQRSSDLRAIPVPVFGATHGVDWRNLGYGVQWFVFAAFACFLYWRFLRDAAHPPTPAAASTTTTTGAPTP